MGEHLESFARASFRTIPPRYSAIKKVGQHFCISLTPFPTNTLDVSTLSLSSKRSHKCRKCKSHASSLAPQDLEKMLWRCPVCLSVNTISNEIVSEQYNIQFQSSVFDFSPNGPQYGPFRAIFVIESSKQAVESGFYKSTLMKLKESLREIELGEITVLVFSDSLLYPCIYREKSTFSLMCIKDISPGALLPPEKLMFDLQNEKEMFFTYLDTLLDEIPLSSSVLSVSSVIECIYSFVDDIRIPCVVCALSADIGQTDQIRSLSLTSFGDGPTFDVFFNSPLSSYSRDDLHGLTTFCISCGGVLRVSELDSLRDEVIRRLFSPRYIRVQIGFESSLAARLVSTHGKGYQRTESVFLSSCMCPDDTIYYVFDIEDPDYPLGYQFRVRFTDLSGKKHSRIITLTTPLSDQFYQDVDPDVIISSSVMQLLESNLDNLPIDPRMLAKFFKTKELKSLLYNANIEELYRTLERNISLVTLTDVYGQSPAAITSLLTPKGYILDIGGEVKGLVSIFNISMPTGALLVPLLPLTNVVVVGEREDVNAWVNSITNGPLSQVISTYINPGSSLLVYSVLDTSPSPLLLLLKNCMRA